MSITKAILTVEFSSRSKNQSSYALQFQSMLAQVIDYWASGGRWKKGKKKK